MIHPYLLMVCSAFLGACGQLLFSMSASSFTLNIKTFISNPSLLLKMLPFGGGLLLYGMAVLLSMLAYRSTEYSVSVLFPIASVVYLFVILLSAVFLHEPITWLKIIGGIVIIGGVLIINL